MKANAVRDRRRHHAGRDDRDRQTYPGPHSVAQVLWSRAMAEAQRRCLGPPAEWGLTPRGAALVRGAWHRQEGDQAQALCRRNLVSHVFVSRPGSSCASRTRDTRLPWNYTRSIEVSPTKARRGRATFGSSTKAERIIFTRQNGSSPLRCRVVSGPRSFADWLGFSPHNPDIQPTAFV